MTAPTMKVLSALLNASVGELSGATIGAEGKIMSGTLYPILSRLEGIGWVESRWEEGDPKELGRPRRRYYRLTGVGATRSRAALAELAPMFGKLAWA